MSRAEVEAGGARLSNAIAGEIKAVMKERGIRHSDLARRLGVARPRVTLILSGRANVTLETLAQVELALGLRWDLRLGCGPDRSCSLTNQGR